METTAPEEPPAELIPATSRGACRRMAGLRAKQVQRDPAHSANPARRMIGNAEIQ